MTKNEHYIILFILLVNIGIAIGMYHLFAPETPKQDILEDCPQFAVICNTPNDNWRELRRGIDLAALECGVAVEYIESVFSGEDADASSIYMAAESNVDGIAVFSVAGEIGNAVQYARDLGIPVVTMVYDETESDLDFFIGVDNANYGRYLQETIQVLTNAENVGLLFNKSANEAYVSAVEAALRERYTLQVISRTSSYIFDVSETVKELVMNDGDLDVICCMDDNTTQGVAQSIVDWNMVNKMRILGVGDSENILSLVEKGIVAATIVTDYEQIGSRSIQVLNDVYRNGQLTLEDISIGLHTVTPDTVSAYLKERKHE